jgi:hypothetical protein
VSRLAPRICSKARPGVDVGCSSVEATSALGTEGRALSMVGRVGRVEERAENALRGC